MQGENSTDWAMVVGATGSVGMACAVALAASVLLVPRSSHRWRIGDA
mgnify:CR=1 FL=1